MNNQDLKQELEYLAKQADLDETGLDDHIDHVIKRGIKDFWTKRGWNFRTREYTLTVTSEAEKYELASDFDGLYDDAAEISSNSGTSLTVMSMSDFKKMVPLSTAHPSNYPFAVTFFRESNKWYAKFFPIPVSGYQIKMTIFVTAPKDVEQIPDTHAECLQLACQKHLYIQPTMKQLAYALYEEEVKDLERKEDIIKGPITQRVATRNIVTEKGYVWE